MQLCEGHGWGGEGVAARNACATSRSSSGCKGSCARSRTYDPLTDRARTAPGTLLAATAEEKRRGEGGGQGGGRLDSKAWWWGVDPPTSSTHYAAHTIAGTHIISPKIASKKIVQFLTCAEFGAHRSDGDAVMAFWNMPCRVDEQ